MTVIRTWTLAAGALLACFTLHEAAAQSPTPEGIYQSKKIKSRAGRNFNANGTVIYQYTRVDRRAKPQDAATVGNIDVGRRAMVRDIYDRTIIDRNLRVNNQSVRMGNVDISGAGNLNTIDNRTLVQGKLESSGGQIITGNVKLHGNARVKALRNNTTIKGDVNVK